FFFQAEDGIRDRNVTGVQTCALPISQVKRDERIFADAHQKLLVNKERVTLFIALLNGNGGEQSRQMVFGLFIHYHSSLLSSTPRSEERRVGKESRAQCWSTS